MKSKLAALVFILMCQTVFAQSIEQAGPRISVALGPVVIRSSENITSENRSSYDKIPYIIGYGLQRSPGIKFLSNYDVVVYSDRSGKGTTEQRKTISTAADYQLTGIVEFTQYGHTLKFDLRSSKSNYYLPTIFGEGNNVFEGFTQLNQAIINKIEEDQLSARDDLRRKTRILFTPQRLHNRELDKKAVLTMLYDFYDQLVPTEKFTFEKFDSAQQHFFINTEDASALVSKSRYDIVISNEVLPGKGELFEITPTLVVKGSSFKLSAIQISPTSTAKIKALQTDLYFLLDTLIQRDGRINNGVVDFFNADYSSTDIMLDSALSLFERKQLLLTAFLSQQAITRSPAYYRGYLMLSLVYLARSHWIEATMSLEKCLTLTKDIDTKLRCYSALAFAYENLGKFGPAVQNYLLVFKENPNYIAAHGELNFLIGNAYMRSDDYVQAIPYLKTARTKSPNDYRIIYMLGSAYLKVNNLREARRIADQLRSIAPDEADSRKLYADIYLRISKEHFKENRFDSATWAAKRSLEANQDKLAYLTLVDINDKQGKYIESRSVIYSGVVHGVFNVPQIYEDRSLLFRVRGPEEVYAKEVIYYIRKSVELNPKNVDNLYRLGNLYSNVLNRNDSAVHFMELAVKQSRRLSDAVYLDLAEAYIKDYKFEAADALLKKYPVNIKAKNGDDNKCISLYLQVVARKLQDLSFEGELEELKRNFKKPISPDSWLFNSFHTWLPTSKIAIAKRDVVLAFSKDFEKGALRDIR